MIGEIYDAVTIGRPYTDIIVDVDETLIRNFQLKKGRITEVSPSELIAIRSELHNFEISPGGSPPNTAACIAALGGRAAFLGKVCNDVGGRAFRNAFDRGGVFFPTTDHPRGMDVVSGTTIVLVTPDEIATVVSTPGVSLYMSETDISDEVVSSAAVTLMQAQMYFIPTSREAALKVMSVVKGARREIMLSLHGLMPSPEEKKLYFEKYVLNTDIVIGNRDEFERFYDMSDLSLYKNDRTLLVMTDGPAGAYVAGRGEYYHIEPYKLGTKPNTVGAGDAFAAGFIMGYTHGLALDKCGEMAAESASAILETVGARPVGSWSHIADKYLLTADGTRRVRSIL